MRVDLHVLARSELTESRLNALAALIDAVEDSFVSALVVLGDFDDGAQILAGVQRALPGIGDIVRRSRCGLRPVR